MHYLIVLLYVAAIFLGFGLTFIGLFVFLLTLNPFVSIIGIAVLASALSLEKNGKARNAKLVEDKVREKVVFPGLNVKCEDLLNGYGYLGVTENYLVFVKNDEVFSFKLNDISAYIVGHKSTNNYVITDNAIIQGGKRVVEIILQNGDHLSWKFTTNNWWTLSFEKKLAKQLRQKIGSTLDTYKVS